MASALGGAFCWVRNSMKERRMRDEDAERQHKEYKAKKRVSVIVWHDALFLALDGIPVIQQHDNTENMVDAVTRAKGYVMWYMDEQRDETDV